MTDRQARALAAPPSASPSPPSVAPPFIVVIPARLASARLPEKALADLGGKPMVVRAAEAAQRSGAREVLIATDTERIADAARANGIDAVLTRRDHPSGTDRLAEVATRFHWPDDTLVVNLQGDEPLIEPALIAQVAAHLAAYPDCAIATAAHPFADPTEVFNPNMVKVVLDARGIALYFSRAPIPWSTEVYRTVYQTAWSEIAQLPAPACPVYRHIGLYAYRAGFLRSYPGLPRAPLETAEALEQLRALWHGCRIAVMITTAAPAAGVDTPADLARVRAWFAAHR